MQKIKQNLLPAIGLLGSLVCLGVFVHDPSFPTPDKLVVFLTFVFMIFKQAKEMLRRLLPFVVLLLVYESFRGIAHRLNDHVNYTLAPRADKFLFGGHLPTVTLQNWLWKGHTSWYDVVLYIPYMLFFVIPLGMALLAWKTREKMYWQVVWTYLFVFFSAFLTFLLFPTAPPWLASQNGYIQHIHWISIDVWASLGIHNFPSVYNHIAPNPVAAVPSLHAAISTLTSLLVFKLYGRRWGMVSLIYPLMIYFGVVYEGEHYAFDVIAGIAYAFAGYWLAPKLVRRLEPLITKFSSSTKNALGLKQ